MSVFGLKPENCVWELTLACCFSCKYCGSGGGKARPGELTTEECLKVADELADLGCRRISLIGGEVFLHPGWKEIITRLVRHGIAVCVISNGYMIDTAMARELKELDIESVALSIDGPREVHDRYRQEGSFMRARRALGVLCDAGVPVSVISTLNHENTPLLEELYRFLLDYPIFAWQLQACLPMGNAAEGAVDFHFDHAAAIRFVEEHAAAPFAVGIADNIGYFTPQEGSLRGNRSGLACFKGCQAGLSVVALDSIGNVRGCESLYDKRFIEGNVRERSLREIWEDPECFAYNRKFRTELLKGKCAGCAEAERCRGGCRSYSYFVKGHFYEAPFCMRERIS
ncbi:MAG: radical SAM protein [Lachnospiraceae bacterium]|nr:radical SAM protein [Lachnospiraceae bacterium]